MIELIRNVYLCTYVEVIRWSNLPYDVLSSGGYVYPILGVHYFFTNPDLWPFYLSILIPQLFITLIIYLVTYVVFFPIIAAFWIIMTGPLGIFTAWWCVFRQASLTSTFVVTYMLMPEIQRIAFDSVLSRESADSVVMLGKLRRIAKVPFYVKCGKLVWIIPDILVLPYTIFKGLLMIAIDYIPIIGWYIVAFIQAPSKALQAHARYFTLKGYDERQVLAIYKANTGAYLGYGIVTSSLETIPLLSVFFMFTNTLGAAIWAVKIEKEHKINGMDTLKFLDLPEAQKFTHPEEVTNPQVRRRSKVENDGEEGNEGNEVNEVEEGEVEGKEGGGNEKM